MRRSEFISTSEKPAARYLEWASDKGQFKYYDRDKSENVFLELPRFIVLMQMHTVKGWNDASESAIWSNEVKIIASEEMEVKAFKGGVIVKGYYKEIKDKIVKAGGHYVKSIYIMVETASGSEVWNLQLKGAVVQQWGDTFNKCQNRFADEWISLESVEKKKKGKVEYTVPIFKFEGVTSDSEAKLADSSYDTLAERLKVKADSPALQVSDKPIGNIEANFIEDAISDMLDDDLPF